MRTRCTYAPIFTATLLATSSCGVPSEDVASAEDAFRYALDGDHEHDDMTEDALSFLRSSVRERIGDYNEDTDHGGTKLQSRYHADNCRVREAFATMNEHFELAVVSADPSAPDYGSVERNFGRVLHIAQDFYAHSNWTESGQTEIADSSILGWPDVVAGSSIGEMALLEDSLPEELIFRPHQSRLPEFTDGTGVRLGLITGTYRDNEDASICPPEASIPHGPFLTGTMATHDYLSKDNPRSAHHEEAANFAVRQTTEELCRLFRLVTVRYGEPAATALADAWVSDEVGFESACGENPSRLAALFMASLGS